MSSNVNPSPILESRFRIPYFEGKDRKSLPEDQMKDLGLAFSSPFKDPAWVSKFVIAGAFLFLCLFGIGIPVIVGYLIQVTQRVMRQEEHPLPEWTDVGVKFILGFKYCVVYFVYLLPVFLLVVPLIVFAVAAQMTEAPDAVGIFVTVYTFAFTLLIIPYSLALTALSPIIAYRFALRERISDGLNLAAVIGDFKAHWQSTLVVALIAVGVQSFAFVGIFLLIIGVVFSIFYAYLVSAYMHGALYVELPPERKGERAS